MLCVLQLLLSQREAEARNVDDFFKFLRGSTDGFDFIVGCFGRNLFPSSQVSDALLNKSLKACHLDCRAEAESLLCGGQNMF